MSFCRSGYFILRKAPIVEKWDNVTSLDFFLNSFEFSSVRRILSMEVYFFAAPKSYLNSTSMSLRFLFLK